MSLADRVEQTESGGENVVNHKSGATGPMQILKGTWEHLARKFGFSTGDINNPEANRVAGREYLREMKAMFGDDALALAAYNAGPGRVKQWLEDYGHPEPGHGREWVAAHVPFSETRNYVSKIMGGGGTELANDNEIDESVRPSRSGFRTVVYNPSQDGGLPINPRLASANSNVSAGDTLLTDKDADALTASTFAAQQGNVGASQAMQPQPPMEAPGFWAGLKDFFLNPFGMRGDPYGLQQNTAVASAGGETPGGMFGWLGRNLNPANWFGGNSSNPTALAAGAPAQPSSQPYAQQAAYNPPTVVTPEMLSAKGGDLNTAELGFLQQGGAMQSYAQISAAAPQSGLPGVASLPPGTTRRV